MGWTDDVTSTASVQVIPEALPSGECTYAVPEELRLWLREGWDWIWDIPDLPGKEVLVPLFGGQRIPGGTFQVVVQASARYQTDVSMWVELKDWQGDEAEEKGREFVPLSSVESREAETLLRDEQGQLPEFPGSSGHLIAEFCGVVALMLLLVLGALLRLRKADLHLVLKVD